MVKCISQVCHSLGSVLLILCFRFIGLWQIDLVIKKSMYQPSFFSCCQKNLFCHGNIYPILPYRSPGTAHHDPCAGITNQRCIRKSQFFRLGTRCVKHTPRRQHDVYPSVFCFPYNILGKIGKRHIIMKKSSVQINRRHFDFHSISPL